MEEERYTKMKVEIKDRRSGNKDNVSTHNVRYSYLTKFVETDKKYPVEYTIK